MLAAAAFEEIRQIDTRLESMPDEGLLACGDVMEARQTLVESIAAAPAPPALSDLRALQAATARLTARVRMARERAVAGFGASHRSRNLARALSGPVSSQSSYFG